MGIATDQAVVINFFGGELRQRRRLLQLAMSCWIDPNELEDQLVTVSWQEGRTKFGFAYTLNADRFSVEEIKNVASHGVSRMAIVCADRALDEEIFQDESVGGKKLWVLNLNVTRLLTGDELGMSTGAVQGALSGLEQSFVGEFLLQWMRACRPRMKDIRNWIRSQARYEYENDLLTIARSVRNSEAEQGHLASDLWASYAPRILRAPRKTFPVLPLRWRPDFDLIPMIRYSLFQPRTRSEAQRAWRHVAGVVLTPMSVRNAGSGAQHNHQIKMIGAVSAFREICLSRNR
jgi:hypothetical protein